MCETASQQNTLQPLKPCRWLKSEIATYNDWNNWSVGITPRLNGDLWRLVILSSNLIMKNGHTEPAADGSLGGIRGGVTAPFPGLCSP